jgi:hypothetical protein
MPIITPSFEEIKPGKHICEIDSVEIKRSQAGNEYLSWRLIEEKFRSVFYYSTPISGRGAGMFKHLVHSAGEISYQEGPFNTDLLVGRRLECDVDYEEYNGRTQLKVKSVNPCQVSFPSFDDYSNIAL